LPSSALGTCDFLLFFDKLFDSLNGSLIKPGNGKYLRCAVTKTSPHLKFWDEAIHVLDTIRFFSSKNKEFVPPSVKNWITTMKGFSYLWKKMGRQGLQFLCTRNFNQDPVENFFSCIRSHGVRNINPTCSSFTASYKSLLINNFVSSHSPGANCEEDEHEGALDSLRHFIETSQGPDNPTVEIVVETEHAAEVPQRDPAPLLIQTHAYIAGYMAKKILKQVGICKTCRSDLLVGSGVENDYHNLIKFREYAPRALLRPNTPFIILFGRCTEITHYFLSQLCVEQQFKQKLAAKIAGNVKNNFVCEKHNLFKIFVTHFLNFYIHTWIKNVNMILKGLDIRSANDEIKMLALNRYKKYKVRKAAMAKLKKNV
jgi:hypothetical protein